MAALIAVPAATPAPGRNLVVAYTQVTKAAQHQSRVSVRPKRAGLPVCGSRAPECSRTPDWAPGGARAARIAAVS